MAGVAGSRSSARSTTAATMIVAAASPVSVVKAMWYPTASAAARSAPVECKRRVCARAVMMADVSWERAVVAVATALSRSRGHIASLSRSARICARSGAGRAARRRRTASIAPVLAVAPARAGCARARAVSSAFWRSGNSERPSRGAAGQAAVPWSAAPWPQPASAPAGPGRRPVNFGKWSRSLPWCSWLCHTCWLRNLPRGWSAGLAFPRGEP
jgi:hypothetical protein